MNYSELSSIADAGFPPGHPAGADNFVSAGAVLSGRGQGGGGSLAPDLQVHGRSATERSIEETSTVHVPTIMIAVEDSEESVAAVRTAHRLFGDGARYFVVSIGQGRYSSTRWAYVYPVMMPAVWSLPREHQAVEARARERRRSHWPTPTEPRPHRCRTDPVRAMIEYEVRS